MQLPISELGFFNIVRYNIFPQFGSYFWKKTDKIFMTVLSDMCLW